MNFKKVFSFILFFFSLIPFFSESFRVRKLHPVTLNQNPDFEETVYSGINDSIAVLLPQEKKYLEGIELKISVPVSVAQWRDSVAFSVYDNILPEPSASQIDYSGTKIFVSAVPTKLSWNVLIPVTQSNSIKDGSYNTLKLNVIPNLKNNLIFIRFQPAMKGIPEETFDAEFKITVKPILINKGNLSLSISTYDKKENLYSIFIDGISYPQGTKNAFLDTGMHTLNIQSEFYRNETRSIYIEQAKDTQIEIKLQSLNPMLKITAPANTKIFIDDTNIPHSETKENIPISEGEHKLRFQIGDYDILRPLTIEKGKTYNINLTVDLQITEE